MLLGTTDRLNISSSLSVSRWNRPDLDPEVGMTVINIEIPSGFVVARDSIEALYNKRIPGLKRVRFRGGTLIILYEYVSR